jgi:hypothetical protein
MTKKKLRSLLFHLEACQDRLPYGAADGRTIEQIWSDLDHPFGFSWLAIHTNYDVAVAQRVGVMAARRAIADFEKAGLDAERFVTPIVDLWEQANAGQYSVADLYDRAREWRDDAYSGTTRKQAALKRAGKACWPKWKSNNWTNNATHATATHVYRPGYFAYTLYNTIARSGGGWHHLQSLCHDLTYASLLEHKDMAECYRAVIDFADFERHLDATYERVVPKRVAMAA